MLIYCDDTCLAPCFLGCLFLSSFCVAYLRCTHNPFFFFLDFFSLIMNIRPTPTRKKRWMMTAARIPPRSMTATRSVLRFKSRAPRWWCSVPFARCDFWMDVCMHVRWWTTFLLAHKNFQIIVAWLRCCVLFIFTFFCPIKIPFPYLQLVESVGCFCQDDISGLYVNWVV